MSTFKIFDGTNWVDPCNCNISILDISGTQFQQINPNNCIVSYFDGTNWCPITCPCECPEGYTFNSATNSCEFIEIIPASPVGGATVPIEAGSVSSAFGDFGARLYENITGLTYPLNGWQDASLCPPPPPFENTLCGAGYQVYENAGVGTMLTIQQTSVPFNDIFDSQGTTTLGRLNNVGLWATGFPEDEWLEVEFCINIAKTETYIFAMAGDNQIKADITSSTFNGGGTFNLVNLWTSNNPTGTPEGFTASPFKFWHMFPITLPAGSHTLKLVGMNLDLQAAFGAEIYDISIPDLIALMTSTSVTAADLEPYIVFSTANLITTPPLVVALPGETITWACPDGYTYSLCYGAPSCIITDSIPCGEGVPLKAQTEINIWFDNAGSMDTTLQPLQLMQQTLLKELLLPLYGYNEDVYREKVQILFMESGSWNYKQRFIAGLATPRNFNRTVDTSVDTVINLTFSDRSEIYGYGRGEVFNSTVRTSGYDDDISQLRTVLADPDFKIYGTAFRVNTGPNAFTGFGQLTQATFVNNGVYTVPNNVNDFYSKQLNCNLDTLPAGTPQYYYNQIVASLKALGINIPVIK